MGVQRKTTILAATVLAAAVGGYCYFRRARKLTDEDFILLTDFANTTGDTIFDDTLRQGLATKLENPRS